jgi:cytochrome c peroxidase
MNLVKSVIIALLLFPLMVIGSTSHAESGKLNTPMEELLQSYRLEAQKGEPGFKAFSAEEGKKLFFMTRLHSKVKKERSCTTCHTKNPTHEGRTPVGKVIKPIARSANSDRYTDPKKVKKWFRRNCKWVLERECTAQEKGNYITFMLSQ